LQFLVAFKATLNSHSNINQSLTPHGLCKIDVSFLRQMLKNRSLPVILAALHNHFAASCQIGPCG
jgi:hypothetical protein